MHPIACGSEPANELVVRPLGQRVELHLPPGPAQRASEVTGCLGPFREASERFHRPVAMFVTRLVHPVVVQPGEQLTSAQLESLLKPVCRKQLGKGRGVDPYRRPGGEAYAFARRDQSISARAEHPAKGPQ